jgi:predicted nucleic acid-binding protein
MKRASWSLLTGTCARNGRSTGVRLESGIVPVVPAPVVAQVSRSPAQVQLRRLLCGCEVVTLTDQTAHAAGQLLGRAAADVVDAAVAQTAADLRADVLTGDRADISRLLQVAGASSQIIDV